MMEIIRWDEVLATGIEKIDSDHKHLVDLLNRVYDGFMKGSAAQATGSVLDELVNYACYHFATEERWMSAVHFPGHEEQKRQHAVFSRRVVELQSEFHAGKKSGLSLQTLTFLRDWLVAHIREEDGQFGAFIERTGAPPPCEDPDDVAQQGASHR